MHRKSPAWLPNETKITVLSPNNEKTDFMFRIRNNGLDQWNTDMFRILRKGWQLWDTENVCLQHHAEFLPIP